MDNGAVVVDMRNHYESEIGRLKELYVQKQKLLKKNCHKLSQYLKEKKTNKFYCTAQEE